MRLMRIGQRRGFTLIEVLVALAILLAGLVAIVQLFPVSLRASADAALQGEAVFLAQQKVDELRRDRDQQSDIIDHIQGLATPTDAIVFPQQPRLTYSYSGTSMLYPDVDPADPRSFPNVARVIIRKAPEFDPDETVLYELRFDS